MKNYALTEDEEKNFVLSYKIKNNKIIIKMANDEELSLPYNEDNIKFVLDKMKKQVLNSNKSYESNKNLILYYSILNVIMSLIVVLNLHSFSIFSDISNIIISLFGAGALVYNSVNIKKSYDIIHDINKNKLLIEYEEKLNSKENELDKNKKLDINLNNTENLSYYKLFRSMDDISYYEDNNYDKPKTLVRKR